MLKNINLPILNKAKEFLLQRLNIIKYFKASLNKIKLLLELNTKSFKVLSIKIKILLELNTNSFKVLSIKTKLLEKCNTKINVLHHKIIFNQY